MKWKQALKASDVGAARRYLRDGTDRDGREPNVLLRDGEKVKAFRVVEDVAWERRRLASAKALEDWEPVLGGRTGAPGPLTRPAVEQDWIDPRPVSGPDLAFPAHVIGKLLPPEDAIPKRYPNREHWVGVQRAWFFMGLDPRSLRAKKGVDKAKALRQLSACQRSYEPSHEHKQDGVAWLLSLWFEVS